MFKRKPRERTRLIKNVSSVEVDVPNLLDLQVKSFERFIKEGIGEELKSISPIVGYGGKYQMEFLDGYYVMDPEVEFNEAKHREISYTGSLRVPVRLISSETGEVQEQEVFMSDIPLMTDRGTFLINGAERVVVTQFVRSPGVYFRQKIGLTRDKISHISTVIPHRGSWLEIEVDHNGIAFAHINKSKRLPVTYLLSALGFSNEEMVSKSSQPDIMKATFDKSPFETQDEALIYIYKNLRSGEPISIDGAKSLLENMFFNEAKYDLGRVGRHKINNRLDLSVDSNVVTLTNEDIFSIVNYTLDLHVGKGSMDDIDHLGNRRVRTVGEQLQRQFRIGLARLERLIREQMALKGGESVSPQSLINIRPLVAVMREFFGSSQLSQFMDQTNPLAEIVHKRRLSSLGPGGLTKERAGFEVRDIHPTHYGRICPIETPEGPNAGLIGPLASFAVVNEFGFIESPYHPVKNGKISDKVVYLSPLI